MAQSQRTQGIEKAPDRKLTEIANKVNDRAFLFLLQCSEVAMKLIIEKIPDLQALYEKQLRLLLSAEEMSAIKFHFFVDSATDSELHQALREHQQETVIHADRLRDILSHTVEGVDPLKCKVIYALFDEAEDLLKGVSQEAVRHALLIAAAQRIEHYEIAAYGTVRQFASVLGHDEDAQKLDQTIREEGRADHRLTRIAERINPTAKKVA
jgi:ferritin-like metal-binding protein YciE